MPYLEETVINRDLVLGFFLKFSRFEFALKLAGYARGNITRVEPDWIRFAATIKGIFNKNHNPRLAQACEYFLSNPPNQQVRVGGSLGWSTQPPANANTEPELLIALVKRVRNNLFHGGKYNAQMHEETARSERLLSGSLLILEECLRVSPRVKHAYDGATI